MHTQGQKNNNTFKQAGITLLLSILVLASIMAISLSLASITFLEIRSSSDLQKTEPAFYSAETGTEESLYATRRQISNTTFETNSVNGISITSTTQKINNPIFQDKVLQTSNSYTNTANKYELYNINNFYSPSSGGDYSKINITFLNTGTTGYLNVYDCNYNPQGEYNCDSSTSSNVTAYPPLQPGQTDTISLPATATNNRLIIYAYYTSATAYINVETYGTGSNQTPKGMPLTGSVNVDIAAAGSSLTREIQVNIPNSYTSGGSSVGGYTHHRVITINGAQISTVNHTTLNYFPVLINFSDPTFKSASNGGEIQSPNGYDIVFSSDPVGNSPLNFEQENYSATNGQIVYWVQVPTLINGSSTPIYMWYDKAGVNSFQSAGSPWDSNFEGVWHLPNGTVLSANDSTGNGNSTNTFNGVTAVASPLDGPPL